MVFYNCISHFYISYSNVNEISYFKDIVIRMSKTPFWIAAWRWIYKEAETCLWFNYILIIWYNKSCVRLKMCIHFINYTLLFYVVSSHTFRVISSHHRGDQFQGTYLCICVESHCRALHIFCIWQMQNIWFRCVLYTVHKTDMCIAVRDMLEMIQFTNLCIAS